jgi:pheromone shutdown-related protein TraB
MIERVTIDGTEVVLVGTAHVSADSADEAVQVIDDENPDVVCVELDEKRYESLTAEEQWKNLEVKEALKEGKGSVLLMNILLSVYQKRIGASLDIRPGAEMVAAVDAADDRDIPVSLIDRDIQDTLHDALNALSMTEKLKLLSFGAYGLIADETVTQEDVEELREANIVDSMITQLGDRFPSLKATFLDKRDTHMARRIQELEAENVVVIVGAAHVSGIKEKLTWDSIPAIEPAPTRRFSPFKALKYGIPLLILGMFTYIFVSVGIDAARDAFLFWVLINGGLAATAAVIARAHPFTVVTAFLSAPVASVNPAIPTGLVAAYTENVFSPPTVGDLEAISDIVSYRDFWSNSALRLILIFFLVNLASSIGSYIGAGYLAKVLTGA